MGSYFWNVAMCLVLTGPPQYNKKVKHHMVILCTAISSDIIWLICTKAFYDDNGLKTKR